MDGTAAAIVLLFVITIFQSLGSNQGYAPPGPPPPVVVRTTPAPAPAVPVRSGTVDPSYFSSIGENPRKPILQFILGFRKPDEATRIADAIMKHSQAFDVNPKLVTALMRRESGFNPRAVSSSGALGLGQLLPSTCKTTGVTNPYDIDDNAKGTVRYMKYLLDRFKKYPDPVSFALAGYLEGPNGVARKNGYTAKTAGYIKDILAIYSKI